MMPWRKITTVVIGLFFVVSAISKWFDLRDFELYVFSLGLMGFDLCSLAARCLIVLELGTGLWLLVGYKPAGARALAIVEIVFFSIILVWRLLIGDSRSCHCFGELVEMSPTASLAKNGILLIAVLLCSRVGWRTPKAELLLFLLTAGSGVALFASDPPDFWFRIKGNYSSDIVPERLDTLLSSRGLGGRRMVAFFSTRCSYCRECAAKLDGILKRCDADNDDLYLFFLAVSDSTNNEVIRFLQEYMDGNLYNFEVLQPTEMLPIINGSMPIIALCNSGHLVREFDLLTMDEKAIKDFFATSR